MIDTQACADLLRAMTNHLAAEGHNNDPAAPIEASIAHIRTLSGQAEDSMHSALASLYPDIGWTSEEALPDADDYWLYDPIDGAYHFLQGLPLWSASLVLMRGSQPVLAIVYDPAMDEMFIASQGAGATCNGRSIHVSAKSELGAAVIGTAIPPLAQVGAAEQNEALALVASVARSVFVVRPMAAASLQLAYVAAGRLEAYVETGQDAADWLAGALLIREAGGIVTDLHGAPFGWSGNGILASSQLLHDGLLAATAL